jgi:hypothetical protein
MRLIVLLLASAALLCAQAQPPPQTPGKPYENDQGKSARKQAIETDNQVKPDLISAAIDKLTSEITSWKQQQTAADEKQDAPSNGWIIGSTILSAAATVLIAIVGFLQWRVMGRQRVAMEQQAEYMRVSLEETRKSTDAATRSAKVAEEALHLSQRAMVGVGAIVLKPRTPIPPGFPPIERIVKSCVEFTFKNSGPTIANRCYFECNIKLEGTASEPIVIVSHPTSVNPGDFIGDSSRPLGELFNNRADIAAAFMGGKIQANGFIRYKDVFGSGLLLEFISHLDPNTFEFRISTNIQPDGEQGHAKA